MDEARLSQRELRILAEIEEGLSADERLARRLGTTRPGRSRSRALSGRLGGVRWSSALVVVSLATATVTLLVLAVATEARPLIWAFAAAWVLTLVTLLRLAVRWSRRWAAASRAPRGRAPGAPGEPAP